MPSQAGGFAVDTQEGSVPVEARLTGVATSQGMLAARQKLEAETDPSHPRGSRRCRGDVGPVMLRQKVLNNERINFCSLSHQVYDKFVIATTGNKENNTQL